MPEILGQFGGWIGTTIIVVCLFVRIEHRMTRVETLVTIIAAKVGICQPNLDEPTQ